MKRFIAVLLAVVFLSGDLAHAASSAGVSPAVPLLDRLFQDPYSFEAPLEFSSLRDVHKGGDRLIVHLQDAHANYSGQQNLSSTLDRLISKYGIRTVFVEGSSRDVTLGPLKKAIGSKDVPRFSTALLREGEIAGEEYLNLTSRHDVRLLGIEDVRLYRQSVDAYAALMDRREKALAYLGDVRGAVSKLKKKLYPQALQAYESSSGEFDKKTKALLALAGTEALSAYPNLQKLNELFDRENAIDFTKANLEQAAVLELLAQKGEGAVVDEAMRARESAGGSRLSQASALRTVFAAAAQRGISFSGYSELVKYDEYLRRFCEIELDQVADEQAKLEDAVFVRELAKAPDALLLRSIDRYTGLLEIAYKIQMTTRDFKLFTVNEPDFATADTIAFLNRESARQGFTQDLIEWRPVLEDAQKALVEFYASVDRRDEAFVWNAERLMKNSGEKAAALITGGYHTRHLQELLREKGFSYVVLTPHVTSATNQKKYESLLLGTVRKETKKVRFVEGASQNKKDKALSALDGDLAFANKKSGVKVNGAAEQLAAQGSRLANHLVALGLSPEGLSALRAEFAARPVNPQAPSAARLASASRVTSNQLTLPLFDPPASAPVALNRPLPVAVSGAETPPRFVAAPVIARKSTLVERIAQAKAKVDDLTQRYNALEIRNQSARGWSASLRQEFNQVRVALNLAEKALGKLEAQLAHVNGSRLAKIPESGRPGSVPPVTPVSRSGATGERRDTPQERVWKIEEITAAYRLLGLVPEQLRSEYAADREAALGRLAQAMQSQIPSSANLVGEAYNAGLIKELEFAAQAVRADLENASGARLSDASVVSRRRFLRMGTQTVVLAGSGILLSAFAQRLGAQITPEWLNDYYREFGERFWPRKQAVAIDDYRGQARFLADIQKDEFEFLQRTNRFGPLAGTYEDYIASTRKIMPVLESLVEEALLDIGTRQPAQVTEEIRRGVYRVLVFEEDIQARALGPAFIGLSRSHIEALAARRQKGEKAGLRESLVHEGGHNYNRQMGWFTDGQPNWHPQFGMMDEQTAYMRHLFTMAQNFSSQQTQSTWFLVERMSDASFEGLLARAIRGEPGWQDVYAAIDVVRRFYDDAVSRLPSDRVELLGLYPAANDNRRIEYRATDEQGTVRVFERTFKIKRGNSTEPVMLGGAVALEDLYEFGAEREMKDPASESTFYVEAAKSPKISAALWNKGVRGVLAFLNSFGQQWLNGEPNFLPPADSQRFYRLMTRLRTDILKLRPETLDNPTDGARLAEDEGVLSTTTRRAAILGGLGLAGYALWPSAPKLETGPWNKVQSDTESTVYRTNVSRAFTAGQKISVAMDAPAGAVLESITVYGDGNRQVAFVKTNAALLLANRGTKSGSVTIKENAASVTVEVKVKGASSELEKRDIQALFTLTIGARLAESLLHDETAEAMRAVARRVEAEVPDKARVAVVGASGPAVYDAVLAMGDSRKIFMLDIHPIDYERLMGIYRAWDPTDREHPRIREKRESGYYRVTHDTWGGDFEQFLIWEFQALGISQEVLNIEKDARGRIHFRFQIPGESDDREIVFVRTNLLSKDAELDAELDGRVQVYLDKAAQQRGAGHAVMMARISGWMAPNSLLVLNPYDISQMSDRLNVAPLLENAFQDTEQTNAIGHYGRNFEIWKALPNITNDAAVRRAVAGRVFTVEDSVTDWQAFDVLIAQADPDFVPAVRKDEPRMGLYFIAWRDRIEVLSLETSQVLWTEPVGAGEKSYEVMKLFRQQTINDFMKSDPDDWQPAFEEYRDAIVSLRSSDGARLASAQISGSSKSTSSENVLSSWRNTIIFIGWLAFAGAAIQFVASYFLQENVAIHDLMKKIAVMKKAGIEPPAGFTRDVQVYLDKYGALQFHFSNLFGSFQLALGVFSLYPYLLKNLPSPLRPYLSLAVFFLMGPVMNSVEFFQDKEDWLDFAAGLFGAGIGSLIFYGFDRSILRKNQKKQPEADPAGARLAADQNAGSLRRDLLLLLKSFNKPLAESAGKDAEILERLNASPKQIAPDELVMASAAVGRLRVRLFQERFGDLTDFAAISAQPVTLLPLRVQTSSMLKKQMPQVQTIGELAAVDAMFLMARPRSGRGALFDVVNNLRPFGVTLPRAERYFQGEVSEEPTASETAKNLARFSASDQAWLKRRLALLSPLDEHGQRRWNADVQWLGERQSLKEFPAMIPLESLSEQLKAQTALTDSEIGAAIEQIALNQKDVQRQLVSGKAIRVYGYEVRYLPIEGLFLARPIPNLPADAAKEAFGLRAPPRISVNILVYNGWEETVHLLEQFKSIQTPNLHIVALDNGSAESRLPELEKAYQALQLPYPLKLGRSPVNLGFDEGHNVLFDEALDAERSDYAALLNPDIELSPNYFEATVSVFENAGEGTVPGVVGTAVYRLGADGQRKDGQVYSYGNRAPSLNIFAKRAHGNGEPNLDKYPAVMPVDWVSGAAIVYSAEALRRIGGFDPRYFAYREELDMTHRLKAAGFGAYVTKNATVWHKGGFSADSSMSPFIVHLKIRNQFLNLRKHYADYDLVRAIWQLREALDVLIQVLPKDLSEVKFERTAAFIRGVRDGITNRYATVQAEPVELKSVLSSGARLSATTDFDTLMRRLNFQPARLTEDIEPLKEKLRLGLEEQGPAVLELERYLERFPAGASQEQAEASFSAIRTALLDVAALFGPERMHLRRALEMTSIRLYQGLPKPAALLQAGKYFEEPLIIMSEEFWQRMTPLQKTYVIAHELGHVWLRDAAMTQHLPAEEISSDWSTVEEDKADIIGYLATVLLHGTEGLDELERVYEPAFTDGLPEDAGEADAIFGQEEFDPHRTDKNRALFLRGLEEDPQPETLVQKIFETEARFYETVNGIADLSGARLANIRSFFNEIRKHLAEDVKKYGWGDVVISLAAFPALLFYDAIRSPNSQDPFLWFERILGIQTDGAILGDHYNLTIDELTSLVRRAALESIRDERPVEVRIQSQDGRFFQFESLPVEQRPPVYQSGERHVERLIQKIKLYFRDNSDHVSASGRLHVLIERDELDYQATRINIRFYEDVPYSQAFQKFYELLGDYQFTLSVATYILMAHFIGSVPLPTKPIMPLEGYASSRLPAMNYKIQIGDWVSTKVRWSEEKSQYVGGASFGNSKKQSAPYALFWGNILRLKLGPSSPDDQGMFQRIFKNSLPIKVRLYELHRDGSRTYFEILSKLKSDGTVEALIPQNFRLRGVYGIDFELPSTPSGSLPVLEVKSIELDQTPWWLKSQGARLAAESDFSKWHMFNSINVSVLDQPDPYGIDRRSLHQAALGVGEEKAMERLLENPDRLAAIQRHDMSAASEYYLSQVDFARQSFEQLYAAALLAHRKGMRDSEQLTPAIIIRLTSDLADRLYPATLRGTDKEPSGNENTAFQSSFSVSRSGEQVTIVIERPEQHTVTFGNGEVGIDGRVYDSPEKVGIEDLFILDRALAGLGSSDEPIFADIRNRWSIGSGARLASPAEAFRDFMLNVPDSNPEEYGDRWAQAQLQIGLDHAQRLHWKSASLLKANDERPILNKNQKAALASARDEMMSYLVPWAEGHAGDEGQLKFGFPEFLHLAPAKLLVLEKEKSLSLVFARPPASVDPAKFLPAGFTIGSNSRTPVLFILRSIMGDAAHVEATYMASPAYVMEEFLSVMPDTGGLQGRALDAAVKEYVADRVAMFGSQWADVMIDALDMSYPGLQYISTPEEDLRGLAWRMLSELHKVRDAAIAEIDSPAAQPVQAAAIDGFTAIPALVASEEGVEQLDLGLSLGRKIEALNKPVPTRIFEPVIYKEDATGHYYLAFKSRRLEAALKQAQIYEKFGRRLGNLAEYKRVKSADGLTRVLTRIVQTYEDAELADLGLERLLLSSLFLLSLDHQPKTQRNVYVRNRAEGPAHLLFDYENALEPSGLQAMPAESHILSLSQDFRDLGLNRSRMQALVADLPAPARQKEILLSALDAVEQMARTRFGSELYSGARLAANGMTPLVDAGPDWIKLQQWQEAHQGEYRELARFIGLMMKQTTLYVSFDDFKTALRTASDRFNNKVQKPYVVYFQSPQDSSRWVYNLGLQEGLRPADHVSSDPNELKAYVRDHAVEHVLFIDDASYSFEQGYQRIDGIKRMFKDDAQKTKTVKIHVLVPYMTSYAARRAREDADHVYTAKNLPALENIYSRLLRGTRGGRKIAGFDRASIESLYAKLKDAFGVDDAGGRFSNSVTLTYFQHKIPDSMSFLWNTNGDKPITAGPLLGGEGAVPFVPPITSSPYHPNYLNSVRSLLGTEWGSRVDTEELARLESAGEEVGARLAVEGVPYIEDYISRNLSDLEAAYDLSADFENGNIPGDAEILMIGVGRGYAAAQLALLHPRLKITAVNREQGLWNVSKIVQELQSSSYAVSGRNYSEPEIREALGRIKLEILDFDSEDERSSLGAGRRFAAVIFETRVLLYFEDKMAAIQDAFNRLVAAGGILATAVDKSYFEGETPVDTYDPGVAAIVQESFESADAELLNQGTVRNNLYLKYKKTGNDVRIPLVFRQRVKLRPINGEVGAIQSFYSLSSSAARLARDGEVDKPGAHTIVELWKSKRWLPIGVDDEVMSEADLRAGIDSELLVHNGQGGLRFNDARRRELLPDFWYQGTSHFYASNPGRELLLGARRGKVDAGNLTRDYDYAKSYETSGHPIIAFDFSADRLAAIPYFDRPFARSVGLYQHLPLSRLTKESKAALLRLANLTEAEWKTAADSLGMSEEEAKALVGAPASGARLAVDVEAARAQIVSRLDGPIKLLEEEFISRVDLGRLARIGFHGELAGHPPTGQYWYFVVDPKMDDYWRPEFRGERDMETRIDLRKGKLNPRDVFMDSRTFLQSLFATVNDTAKYTEDYRKPGEAFPGIDLLAASDTFPLRENSQIGETDRYFTGVFRGGEFDLVSEEFPRFHQKGSVAAGNVPPSAIIAQVALTVDEEKVAANWAEQLVGENDPSGRKNTAAYFEKRFLYVKLLKAVMDYASGARLAENLYRLENLPGFEGYAVRVYEETLEDRVKLEADVFRLEGEKELPMFDRVELEVHPADRHINVLEMYPRLPDKSSPEYLEGRGMTLLRALVAPYAGYALSADGSATFQKAFARQGDFKPVTFDADRAGFELLRHEALSDAQGIKRDLLRTMTLYGTVPSGMRDYRRLVSAARLAETAPVDSDRFADTHGAIEGRRLTKIDDLTLNDFELLGIIAAGRALSPNEHYSVGFANGSAMVSSAAPNVVVLSALNEETLAFEEIGPIELTEAQMTRGRELLAELKGRSLQKLIDQKNVAIPASAAEVRASMQMITLTRPAKTTDLPVMVDLVGADLIPLDIPEIAEMLQRAKPMLAERNIFLNIIGDGYAGLSDAPKPGVVYQRALLASKESVMAMDVSPDSGLALVQREQGKIVALIVAIVTAADAKRSVDPLVTERRLRYLTGNGLLKLSADQARHLAQVPADFADRKETYLNDIYVPLSFRTLELVFEQVTAYAKMMLAVGSSA